MGLRAPGPLLHRSLGSRASYATPHAPGAKRVRANGLRGGRRQAPDGAAPGTRATAARARRGEATAAGRGKGQEQGTGAPEVAAGVASSLTQGVQERGKVDANGGGKGEAMLGQAPGGAAAVRVGKEATASMRTTPERGQRATASGRRRG
nr:uncharacterized protein LOC109743858 [Aegilops tauschii subsp. strangulata]